MALAGVALAGVLTLEDLHAQEEDPPAPVTATSAPAAAPDAAAHGMSAIEAMLDACKALFRDQLQQRDAAAAAQGAEALRVFGYFAFLGVREAHRRRKVGDALVAAGAEALRADGFAYGVAFCTSRKSAALFAARGFARWGGVSYQEFAMPDGAHPFASLPRDECAVMVRDLRG